MSETLEFFDCLFGYKPEDLWVLVWGLKGDEKRSVWARTTEEASAAAQGFGDGWNVYFGVALSPRAYGPKERLKRGEREPAGIFGLWSDIDLLGPDHATKAYPPDLAAVEEFLTVVEFAPTTVIHSGHGVQCFWAFKEPWIFDTEEERERARSLARRWNEHLQQQAARRGWTLDSVSDLERVLRVPGTVNWKSDPVPARTLRNGGPRWDPADFEERLPAATVASGGDPFEDPAEPGGAVRLRRDAEPPFRKFVALCAIDPQFERSWRHQRDDMKDKSLSAYDLALANRAAACEWSDQEIADLLVAHRLEHGKDPQDREKTFRADYIPGTIARAKRSLEKRKAQQEIERFFEDPETPEQRDEKPDRDTLLKHLSALLEFPLVRVVEYESTGHYGLFTAGRPEPVLLPNVSSLIDHERFRNAVARSAKRIIPDIKRDRWRPIAQCLLDVCETETTGQDATREGTVRGWLQDYLQDYSPVEFTEGAVKLRVPMRREEGTVIFLDHVKGWLLRSAGERISRSEGAAILRMFGAEAKTIYCVIDGQETSRTVWVLPKMNR